MLQAALEDYEPATNPATDSDRDKGRQSQSSIRQTLNQAVQLKDLMFKVALELSEPSLSEEESELSRARAQALTGLVKSWDIACNRIRIQQGKPLPGVIKHDPKPAKEAKRAKPQQTLMDQDQPACGPGHTASGVPSQSPVANSTQESAKP